jgi:hypothetical protein
MLLVAGVPMATLEKKANSYEMTWYRDHLRQAIARARSRKIVDSGSADTIDVL